MKVGLEVHQQLATGKLFCRCPAELTEATDRSFTRRLRPASGEDRRIDAAARYQASLGRRFRYESGPSNCLVEMDEEPPHPLDDAALDVALTFALLVDARPIDEIVVMRKIVVDGSNTSGFQRTALVAVDGRLTVDGREYSIASICLEEDAARKVGESDDETTYRLDRLGVPLVEVATGPEIVAGGEARRVAEEIGALLRATRATRRGIGAIREDLNVSAEGGARIEIKGVQELARIREYVEGEERRQRALLAIRDELRTRHARVGVDDGVDVAVALRAVRTGPLAPTAWAGGGARALLLYGFAGVIGSRPGTDERLGRELADQVRALGLRGLVHSDELPGCGIDPEGVVNLRHQLGLTDADGFVLIADRSSDRLRSALARVAERARAAIDGIPGETRDPLPDGRTRYSRPIPGRHRMYPETDVPPIPVDAARLDRLRGNLPERPSERIARLQSEQGLGPEMARQLAYGDELDRFDEMTKSGHAPGLVARLLTQELPTFNSGRESSYAPTVATLSAVVAAVEAGQLSKEGIPNVLLALANGSSTVSAAIEQTGLSGFSAEDLQALVAEVVRGQSALVRSRGKDAFSPLMGDVMREVRGRRDGREIAETLRREIDRLLAEPAG